MCARISKSIDPQGNLGTDRVCVYKTCSSTATETEMIFEDASHERLEAVRNGSHFWHLLGGAWSWATPKNRCLGADNATIRP